MLSTAKTSLAVIMFTGIVAFLLRKHRDQVLSKRVEPGASWDNACANVPSTWSHRAGDTLHLGRVDPKYTAQRARAALPLPSWTAPSRDHRWERELSTQDFRTSHKITAVPVCRVPGREKGQRTVVEAAHNWVWLVQEALSDSVMASPQLQSPFRHRKNLTISKE